LGLKGATVKINIENLSGIAEVIGADKLIDFTVALDWIK
jgi:hypothetical protein